MEVGSVPGGGCKSRVPIRFVPDDWLDVLVATRLLHEFVALLVHKQFALDALESLPAQSPDPVFAEGTECTLK